jgi:hypothetical protein
MKPHHYPPTTITLFFASLLAAMTGEGPAALFAFLAIISHVAYGCYYFNRTTIAVGIFLIVYLTLITCQN